MYVLYLDESGTHGEASYFVLAGLAAYERDIHWYNQDLDALQRDIFPEEDAPVPFHATRLRTRTNDRTEEPWSRLTVQERQDVKNKVYSIIRSRNATLFACAVEKRYAEIRKENPYERAFEDLVSRFDLYLSRLNRVATSDGRDEQRGLIVLAQSSYQKAITILARRVQSGGTRWRALHNIADIPLFAPAHDTRMLQYADFCSNAVYGRYHAGLARDFDLIAPKFDREGNIFHGLAHLTTDSGCVCPACLSRGGRQAGLPL